MSHPAGGLRPLQPYSPQVLHFVQDGHPVENCSTLYSLLSILYSLFSILYSLELARPTSFTSSGPPRSQRQLNYRMMWKQCAKSNCHSIHARSRTTEINRSEASGLVVCRFTSTQASSQSAESIGRTSSGTRLRKA